MNPGLRHSRRSLPVEDPPSASGAEQQAGSKPPTHESFLVYQRGVHAWRAALLAAGAAALYIVQNLRGDSMGRTWVSYILGTIGALLIVWLTLLGLRKRSYHSSLGTVEGWLSAHVYFGGALLLIATLHSEGKVQINIHGAAYVLMCLVIATGLYGVYSYRRYPMLMMRNRGGYSRRQLLQEIAELDGKCESVARNLGEEVLTVIRSAIDRTVLGGSWSQLVRGRDASMVALPGVNGASRSRFRANPDQKTVIAYLSERLGKSGGAAETLWFQELIDLCAKRQNALQRVRTDIRLQTLLSAWLKLHVPLTFALWGALTAHIVSEFVYW